MIIIDLVMQYLLLRHYNYFKNNNNVIKYI